jgi:hypothetical protein
MRESLKAVAAGVACALAGAAPYGAGTAGAGQSTANSTHEPYKAGVDLDTGHMFLKDKADPPAYLKHCATPGTWKCTTVQFKSATRRHIERDLGCEIIAGFGDQYSDFGGGYADRSYKLPNPTYFVS